MKSICFFSSYFEKNELPYFIKCYLIELKHHFDELVLISNDKIPGNDDMLFLSEHEIEWMPVKNEGYDFGMWYKAFKKKNISDYDRVALVNDSCILFKKLDDTMKVINSSGWDYAGLLDSDQIDYHIQSYFLVMNKQAIKYVNEYFSTHGIRQDIDDVIKTYEIGLTPFLLSKQMKIGSVYSHTVCGPNLNPSFYGVEALIRSGFPMIKKKIIFGNYKRGEISNLGMGRFKFSPSYYLNLVKKYTKDPIINLGVLKREYNSRVFSGIFFRSLYWTNYFRLRSAAITVYRNYFKWIFRS
jgi:lipopolysaccharide biosynthesis protein